MTTWPRIAVHLVIAAAVAALLVSGIVYPFLPGRHDSLALPLSTMVQVFGVVGLILTPIGFWWLGAPRRRFVLGGVSLLLGSVVAIILSLVVALSVGWSFGALTLVVFVGVVVRAAAGLKRLRAVEGDAVDAAPVYLVVVPLAVFAAQLVLAAPLTEQSRERAMANAEAFITDIETYRDKHGRYPQSLEAQYGDYEAGVVGVARYVYMPEGDGYSLVFEQPRFLLDRIGTREWVVYNPRDEHRAYSHAAWRLLAPEVQGRAQGWYESADAGRPHWKAFYFD